MEHETKDKKIYLLSKHKLIAIISSQRQDLSEDFLEVINQLYQAGVRVFEITSTTPNALGLIKLLHEFKFQISNNKLQTNSKFQILNSKHILIGVGTIQSIKDLRPYVKFVDFAVSDIIPDRATFELAQEHQIVMIPGALTPNEIKQAYKQGANFVKVFPASWIGSDGLKAIKRTHGNIPLVPTGGIKSNQIKEYLSVGACAFGVGKEIFNDDVLEEARRNSQNSHKGNNGYKVFGDRASKFVRAVKPRIFSLGEAMVEILIERDYQQVKKIPEELLTKFISKMDYREGLKSRWRSGSLCRDLDKILGQDDVEAGQEVEINAGEDAVVIRAAGDAANVLTVPAQMGAEAILLSGFSDCRSGQFLRQWYQSRGFNLQYCQSIKNAHCGSFFLLSIGKRYSRLNSAVNKAKFSKIQYRKGDILHFSGISQMISPHSRQQCLKQVQAAADVGVKISYNLNDRTVLRESKQELQNAFQEVAPFINYLFLGAEETKEVFGLKFNLPHSRQTFIKTAQFISQKFFKQCHKLETLIVTGGKLGFCLVTMPDGADYSIVYYPSDIIPRNKIVEPVGAGDSLIGGFLYALLRQFLPVKAAEVANITAGFSLLNRGSGGLDSQIGLIEIKELLQKHYSWSKGEVMRL
ncbi:MAG: PfkB family carbohydrate kinase [Candidatus Jacksonbacteria bacterium]